MTSRRSLPGFLVTAAVLLAAASSTMALPETSRAETPQPAPAVQATPSAGESPRRKGEPGTVLFHVIMILAKTDAGGAPPSLPPAARKALDDVRDLLPFRSYELLDTALIRISRSGATSLKGPSGRPFTVALEAATDEGARQVSVHGFHVVDETITPARKEEVGSGNVKHTSEVPEGKPRMVLRTNFSVGVGETVVVGTSRLDGGDSALVFLVTAVPPSGT